MTDEPKDEAADPLSIWLRDCSLALRIALKPKLTGKLPGAGGAGQRLWREGNLRAWMMRSSTLFAW